MTLGTFAVALFGLYALTGLWLTHDAANRWAIAIAFAVAASGAADKAASPWAAQAPSGTTAPNADPPDRPDADSPDPPPQPADGHRWLTRDRVTTAVVSAAVTAAVSAVFYGLLAPEPDHDGSPVSATAASTTRPSGPATTTPNAYTPVYRDRTLSLKNYNYYFDLPTGAVRGSETAWSVSTDAGGDGDGAFEVQPLTDAYVVPGKAVPSAEQCAAKATRHPADGRLHFRQVPPGTTFCLRDTVNGDIATFTVIDLDHGDYAATDDITYYRHR
ncbi:hypothetical protein ACFV23_02675 [Streptomyces sp. NPDC059627]